ncbi:thiamine phosphate synthase [Vibrio pectenicida]|uniref:Thiamine phosphate synthase n=1 Tax=Vibrio pectenicida TaxID=62763 RepID=A0A3R9EBY7_9VIBR|nr:thiamine phosphate synthase [Vibrio pectenicida]RSD30542.1 thiamine phosphate synthase [Vibrio pectenicida]
MTKILIPSSMIGLTSLVQEYLLLAQEQGFNIDEIELGVSPTQFFQLVQHQQSTILSTDLMAEVSGDLTHSFVLYYYSKLVITECIHHPINSIFIAIDDFVESNNKVILNHIDIWSCPVGNEIRALSIKDHSAENFVPEEHFSWVVTLLALDFPIEDCLILARAMSNRAENVSRETFDDGSIFVESSKWVCEFTQFPVPIVEDIRLGIKASWLSKGSLNGFPMVTKQGLGLYPVVDSSELIEKLISLGITTIQLRIKNPNQPDLEQEIIKSIELGHRYNVKIFINDYWQLAIKHGAYGVHLGQEDIHAANLIDINKAGLRLGLSTHSYYELLRVAPLSPSYIAIGHVFPTNTKQLVSKPQGLVRLALYQKLINSIIQPRSPDEPGSDHGIDYPIPTVAIGGINQSNADQVWQCGVSSLAVIGAITSALCLESTIRFFSDLMQDKYPQAIKGRAVTPNDLRKTYDQ